MKPLEGELYKMTRGMHWWAEPQPLIDRLHKAMGWTTHGIHIPYCPLDTLVDSHMRPDLEERLKSKE